MLAQGERAKPEDFVSPEAAIKDPFVLEFLDLKDEYSESELEEALIRHMEDFLLEFCFCRPPASTETGRHLVPRRSAVLSPPPQLPGCH
jgi:hypothetical protein